MDRPQATAPGVLGRFGVPADAEALWRALMTNPRADVPALSLATGMPAEEVEAALQALADSHLVRPSSDPPGVVAIDPALAVETHIARAERKIAEQIEELSALRARVPELASEYARGRASAGDEPGFEIIVGLEDIQRQIYLAGERTTADHRNLVHSQTAAGLRDAKQVDIEQLARGVRQRSIVGPRELADPDFYSELEAIHARGSQIRTRPEIPTRLIIMDRDLAVLPVDPANMDQGAMFVRVRNLIDLLIFIFDHLWSEADQLFTTSSDPAAPVGRPARVLELMAVGTKDARIARTLGTGLRTVRRDVAELKASLGVASRAEVVAAAVRRGWL
jgi:DNA-binding CsgD family transcriptional regulator/predicted transcriptional regulator